MIILFFIYVLLAIPLAVIDITIWKNGSLTGVLSFGFVVMFGYALEELIEYIRLSRRNRRYRR